MTPTGTGPEQGVVGDAGAGAVNTASDVHGGTGHAMPTSGVLIVDKPQGVTSHDVVAAARGALHTKKVGHAGTLDPMATGVLVIGFGNATRLLNVIVEHDKTYEATIRLGLATTTDDADGEIVPIGAVACGDGRGGPTVVHMDPATARSVIESTIAERLLGDIEQVPNTYSAIKIDGHRAYDLAREGRHVDLKARKVTVGAFDVLDVRVGAASTTTPGLPLGESAGDEPMTPAVDVDVRVTCSAGTYIRALARDLGDMLGVGGHLIRLRRTRVGRYAVDDPRTITAHCEQRTFTNRAGETVTRAKAVLDVSGRTLADHVLPMVDATAAAIPMVAIDDDQARDLRFGRRIRIVLPQPSVQASDQASQRPTDRTSDRPLHREGCRRADAPVDAPARFAAYVPRIGDVVALVAPCGPVRAGMTTMTVKPVTVFPDQSAAR